MVDSVAGTTIDPVDSLVELGGEIWRFVDTAGLRRRVSQASGHGVLRQPAHRQRDRGGRGCRRAARRRPSRSREQDQRVIADVVDAGRALVIALQQVGPASTRTAGRPARTGDRPRPARVQWAPRVNVSAKTGRAVDKLARALRTQPGVVGPAHLDRATQHLAHRRRRGDAAAASRRQGAAGAVRDPGRHPPAAVRRCSPPASSRPATAASSSDELREDFDFAGTPIEISVRVREAPWLEEPGLGALARALR